MTLPMIYFFEVRSRSGFLNLGIVDIWFQMILCCVGAVLCNIGGSPNIPTSCIPLSVSVNVPEGGRNYSLTENYSAKASIMYLNLPPKSVLLQNLNRCLQSQCYMKMLYLTFYVYGGNTHQF